MRKENGEYTYKWEPSNEKPILKITKSSLGSFGFCPLNYKYGYLDSIRQKTSPAMIKGTVIHNAQEEFWKMVDVEEARKLADDPMKLQKHFRGLYPEAPEEDYEDIYRAMTAYNTERFIECIDENTLDNFVPVGNEIMLNASFTTEDGIEVHLQGIIDRIFYEDGGYIPMELKTGAWKDTKKTMMRKEMAFYKMLFENADPDDIRAAGLDPDIPFTHWGWYYPASNYVWVEKVSKRSQTAVLNSIDKLINAYVEKEFPAAYYYKKCIHCGHYDHCEAADGGSQNDWF
mgnify:CR=1 FL=1|tara:strand:+ start:1853 stop:2713 length:861 start_codon:yes stop_codon:yes gene_type:complete